MIAHVAPSGYRLAAAAPLAVAVTCALYVGMAHLLMLASQPSEVAPRAPVVMPPAQPERVAPFRPNLMTPPALPPAAERVHIGPLSPPCEQASTCGAAPAPPQLEVRAMWALRATHHEDQGHFPLRRVPAIYPDAMAQQGIEGNCEVRFDLTPEAQPVNIKPICVDVQGNPQSGFDDAVVAAVMQWTFSPKKVRGRPVARNNVIIPFRFRLPDPAPPTPPAPPPG